MFNKRMKFDMRPLYDEVTINVGLINGRHDNPVNMYIFNGEETPTEDAITDELMFNYDKQESIIYDFIFKNVAVKKYGKDMYKDIVAYTSGLVCIPASLIKVCKDNGINLSLMHFNKSATEKFGVDTYSEQIIESYGCNSIRSCFNDIRMSPKNIHLDSYLSFKKFRPGLHLFAVVLNITEKKSDVCNTHRVELYLFNKKNRAKEFCHRLSSKYIYKPEKDIYEDCNISLYDTNINKDNKFIMDTGCIIESWSWSKYNKWTEESTDL